MDLQNFIEKFADAVEVDTADLSKDTIFRELDEWSSLAGLSIISMFDEEYGKDLSIPDFRNAKTIEDLFNLAQ